MLDLLHISKDFIFVLLAVAERRDSVLIALRKRFGIRTLKSFLMILNYFFFFLSRRKAVEIKDEWRCWGKQKQLQCFLFAFKKVRYLDCCCRSEGGNYNVSLFTQANGNLSCDSSHIENNQSVNKALLNEILVLCSTLVFI